MEKRESSLEDLTNCGIAEEFQLWIHELECGSLYDNHFRQALLAEMEGGLLKGVEWICCSCVKFIKGKTKLKYEPLARPVVPPHALIRGLFQGSIPPELQSLTKVELSMISMYSNATRIVFNCGGHFHAKPTVYTIINEDLVDICERLPRIPDHNQFAILRHRLADKSHDFSFNPHRVKAALKWLKVHNHLYSPDKVGYNEDAFDNLESEMALNQRYFEVDDEEFDALPSHLQRATTEDRTPSTNPGISA
jgi:hypothetical protein